MQDAIVCQLQSFYTSHHTEQPIILIIRAESIPFSEYTCSAFV